MEKLISFFFFLSSFLRSASKEKPMTHPLERVLIYPPKRSSHPLLCDFLHHYITFLQFSSPNLLLPAGSPLCSAFPFISNGFLHFLTPFLH
ncbi:hypothetical protein GLYMA_03G012050v4 [Glycine max]|nr:hypothetical protein GLYMA_03G012050v4 [Glycine max]KAH1068142.1 hypothetical protein GYH30_005913 [Glycine max]